MEWKADDMESTCLSLDSTYSSEDTAEVLYPLFRVRRFFYVCIVALSSGYTVRPFGRITGA